MRPPTSDAWRRAALLLLVLSVFLFGCGRAEAEGETTPIAAAATATATTTATTPTEATAVPSATPIASPTATPSPSAVPTDTPTATPTVTPAATAVPTLPPTVAATTQPTEPPAPTPAPTELSAVAPADAVAPDVVNGLPVESFILFPDGARENARAIWQRGREIGRHPNRFSKIGDSVVLTDHYLTRFDSGYYTLRPYDYLQPTIDYFSGSFSRYGVGARVGLHAWALFDPMWADKEWCQPNEHMVACEIRLNNPAVLLIRMGSNDSGPADVFDENMRQLVAYSIEQGVLPVLTTKADRFEGDNRNNETMRAIAADYQIPLIDFDRVAETLPNRGLSGDDVHLTMADADDYTDPKTFERGYPVSDLVMLMMLHALRQEVTS